MLRTCVRATDLQGGGPVRKANARTHGPGLFPAWPLPRRPSLTSRAASARRPCPETACRSVPRAAR
eukprot:4223184-Lingulodinium_polyedra.AAC.1